MDATVDDIVALRLNLNGMGFRLEPSKIKDRCILTKK